MLAGMKNIKPVCEKYFVAYYFCEATNYYIAKTYMRKL